MKTKRKWIFALVATLLVLGFGPLTFAQTAGRSTPASVPPAGAPAGAPAQVNGPVPWVSEISGNAHSLQVRQSDSDWFEATVNTPFGEGDQVWQEVGGNSEIFIDRGTYLRLDEGSGVKFDSLKDNEIAVVLTKGTAEVANGGNSPFYVDVPGQTVIVDRGGLARIRVNDDGVTEVAAKRGRVRASGPAGDLRIEAGQTMTSGPDGKVLRLNRGIAANRFDRWTERRDAELAAVPPPPSNEVTYVPEPVAAEFSSHGVWYNDPEYGQVWRPDVGPDWVPYRDGRWVYRPAWGWTWVSYEPWGWYPYHYGRWVMVSSGWAWAPVYVHTYWSPALVFWVDGPDYIAWQPLPYAVGYSYYVGPDWGYYVNPHYITVVNVYDFHRGGYSHYNRPWTGRCDGSCYYRGAPDRRDLGDIARDYRTSRPDGYTPRSRSPRDDRVYVNRDRGSRSGDLSSRVDYGSGERGRTDRQRTEARPTGASNGRPGNDRGNGNFQFGNNSRPRPAGDNNRSTGDVRGQTRPRPDNAAPSRGNTRPQGGNDNNRGNTRPQPNGNDNNRGNQEARPQGGNPAPNPGNQPTRDNRKNRTRPQPDNNNSPSNNQPDQTRPSPGASPDTGSRPAPNYRPDSGSRPTPNSGSRPRTSAMNNTGTASRPRPDAYRTNSRPVPAATPTYRQPSYQAPAREQAPTYRQPSYQAPAREQAATYRQPSYQAPAREQAPTYRQKSNNPAPARGNGSRPAGYSSSRTSGGSSAPEVRQSSGGGSSRASASPSRSNSSRGKGNRKD